MISNFDGKVFRDLPRYSLDHRSSPFDALLYPDAVEFGQQFRIFFKQQKSLDIKMK